MAKLFFQELDQRRVSISMPTGGDRTIVHGLATYCRESEFGSCLRIAIDDPAGPLEVVLHEGEWINRLIVTGESKDFLIIPDSQPKIAASQKEEAGMPLGQNCSKS
ncbi:MAG TPA: hypothetical protein VFV87_19155 [Pirellulaceae bacterium]|nr:hypothetical protein [Pirellulaceae bacterium]